jgi:hypothetical protein
MPAAAADLVTLEVAASAARKVRRFSAVQGRAVAFDVLVLVLVLRLDCAGAVPFLRDRNRPLVARGTPSPFEGEGGAPSGAEGEGTKSDALERDEIWLNRFGIERTR